MLKFWVDFSLLQTLHVLKCMWSMRSDPVPLVSNVHVVYHPGGRGDVKKEIVLSDF